MPTIPELVERSVRAYGPRVAVADGDRQLTFAEVGDRSGRLANVLGGLTTEPGARVAILMRNRLEYVEWDFAIARAGMVKVPINPRLSDDERRYMLADSGATVLDHRSGRALAGRRSAGRPGPSPRPRGPRR